jgi:hypothetical protein
MQVEQQTVKKVVKKVASKKTPEAEVVSDTSATQDLAPSSTTTMPAPSSSDVKKSKTGGKKKAAVSEQTLEAASTDSATAIATTPLSKVETTSVAPVQEQAETVTEAATDAATKTDVLLEVSFETFHQSFLGVIEKFNEAFTNLKLVPALNKTERKLIVKARKDFSKIYDNFNNALLDSAEKQLISAEKGTAKKTLKRAVDKEKAAIHKPRVVDNKLIEFMGLEEGAQVSRAQALQAINAYVNDLKTNNPELVKVADNKAFKVSGKLETLFEKQLNKEDETKMPNVIKYTDIMKYMSDFFPKIVA